MMHSNNLGWIINKIRDHVNPLIREYIWYRAWPYWRIQDSRDIIIETAKEIRTIVERNLFGNYKRIPNDLIKYEFDSWISFHEESESVFNQIEDEYKEMPEEWNDLELITSEKFIEDFFKEYPSKL